MLTVEDCRRKARGWLRAANEATDPNAAAYCTVARYAAFVVPGFLYSQVHTTKAAVTPNVAGRGENVLEMIRLDHAAFAPDHMLSDRPTKTAGAKLAYR